MRSGIVFGWVVVAASAMPCPAQDVPQVREELEVRERPLLVELPGGLSGRSLEELRERLVVLEDGVERQVTAVAPLAPPEGAGFTRTVIAFDTLHCDRAMAAQAAAALGARAAELLALGPVTTALLGESATEVAAAGADPATLAVELERLAVSACSADPRVAVPALDGLRCPGPPCLLVWVGVGWPVEERTLPDTLAATGEAAKRLAVDGWSVLAVAAGNEPAPGKRRAPDPGLPGSDQTVWTVDLLGGRNGRRAGPDVEASVDLSLAPLRRLVAATGGQLAAGERELERALESIARRSLVYYRSDREPAAGPAPVRVLSRDDPPSELRAPEWAPTGEVVAAGRAPS